MIPDSVTSIEQMAFYKCTSLTEVTIPESVTSIGDIAFGSCASLTEVTILSSVVSVGSRAFEYCGSLTSVTFNGNAPVGFNASAFRYTADGFTVYFREGATGFTEPTWNGYASQSLVSYTVDFDLGLHGTPAGGGELTQSILSGSGASEPIFTVGSGWFFTGWDAPFDSISSDLNITAVYEQALVPVLDISTFYESDAQESIVVDATPITGYPAIFTYQWYFNGFPVPPSWGGAGASYSIDGIVDNEGTWRVEVENGVGMTSETFEYRIFVDSDADGLSNYRETNITLTNSNDSDSDDDGLNDGDELNLHATDPLDSDSDDDEILDGIEVKHQSYGFDPTSDSTAELIAFQEAASDLPGVLTDEQRGKLSLGGVALSPAEGNTLSLDFVVEVSDDLEDWTTVDSLNYSVDTSDSKMFMRVRQP
jgi:hypothetical protein